MHAPSLAFPCSSGVPGRYIVFHDLFDLSFPEYLLGTFCETTQGFKVVGAGKAAAQPPGDRLKNGYMRCNVRHPQFEQRVWELLPTALDYLKFDPFTTNKLELQICGYEHGDMIGPHIDQGGYLSHFYSRWLSFVYYFHRTPRRFSGGELLLYDQDTYASTSTPRDVVDCAHNSMVFFNPLLQHEVRAVQMPNDPFPFGRFTFNGWFLRHDPVVNLARKVVNRVPRPLRKYTGKGGNLIRATMSRFSKS